VEEAGSCVGVLIESLTTILGAPSISNLFATQPALGFRPAAHAATATACDLLY
jgi:hypothetical protein